MNSAVHHSIEDLLARVRGEYLEMPGLTLTEAQARRLWGLDNTTCHQLLGRLLEAQFLARTSGGHYLRADQIVAEHAQPVAPQDYASVSYEVPRIDVRAVGRSRRAVASGSR